MQVSSSPKTICIICIGKKDYDHPKSYELHKDFNLDFESNRLPGKAFNKENVIKKFPLIKGQLGIYCSNPMLDQDVGRGERIK